jgi:peptidoglycan/xylan/chitin deacetylase (PgdA/CDA1 family)
VKNVIKLLLSIPTLLVWRMLCLIRPTEPPGLRILMFHHIPSNQIANFDRLLRYLKQNFTILSPGEAEDWLSNPASVQFAKSNKSLFLITFDDGFVSNDVIAREVLADHDISAIFFICPGLIKIQGSAQAQAVSEQIFDRQIDADELDAHLKLMTWQNLDELVAAGHTIGAHGMMHNRLSEMSGADLNKEIVEAGDILEDKLGGKINWFAYAFGDIDSISSEALSIILGRFKFCRSGIRGATPKNSKWQFSDQLGLDQPFTYQKLILEGGLDFLYRSRQDRFRQLIKDAD